MHYNYRIISNCYHRLASYTEKASLIASFSYKHMHASDVCKFIMGSALYGKSQFLNVVMACMVPGEQ